MWNNLPTKITFVNNKIFVRVDIDNSLILLFDYIGYKLNIINYI